MVRRMVDAMWWISVWFSIIPTSLMLFFLVHGHIDVDIPIKTKVSYLCKKLVASYAARATTEIMENSKKNIS
jgi:hypothetical protein